MICSTLIPSVTNIMKNIYRSGNFSNEFTSTYYDDKNDSFAKIQQYIPSYVNNIYHPAIVKEYKSNMYKAYYYNKLHKGVYLYSENRELDRSMN